MKNSKFIENQIIKTLKKKEQGRSVGDLSIELGIDKSTLYTGARSMAAWNSNSLKGLRNMKRKIIDSN
ncbi:hypothetical protein ACFSKN_09300 [Mariniflexile gromovii]|uniref:Uncharacterized protein n=1 Tax=Mariniflexile gromovii TaxID=362523 RepID=A0ABS4BVC5_9FLAO|nr:hypothetical protein [Mariniflexile gromovii]MBP0904017.1 hypothetical protein [Mariniflexile gromovii]